MTQPGLFQANLMQGQPTHQHVHRTRRKFCPNHSIAFRILWVSLWTPQSFPCCSAGKESARNAGDLGSIPASGRSPGEGQGYPFQYSGLENSMDCIVAKSQTRLSDFHSLTVDSSPLFLFFSKSSVYSDPCLYLADSYFE